jgi:hypothetical protein
MTESHRNPNKTRDIPKKKLLAVFFIALVIRGILFVQVVSHPQVILQPDSRMYVSLAQGLLQHGTFCHSDNPMALNVVRVPGYPFFLASVLWLFQGSLLAIVITQILLDSLSCVLIYYLSDSVLAGTGFISGALAALNMGMITYSHFILTDSLFVFIFIIILLVMFTFMGKPDWKLTIVLGVMTGIASLIRPVVIYLPVVLTIFLFIYFLIEKRYSLFKAISLIILMGSVFVLTLSPWLIRNYIHYGRFQLMAQSGKHMLRFVVPLVWQYSKGIPLVEGIKQASIAFSERAETEGMDLKKTSPFEKSDFQVKVAIDLLRKEPKSAILKAWFSGIAKNIFAPAITDLSYLLNIERPHLLYTREKTFIQRAKDFLQNMQGLFRCAVVASTVVLILTRFLQLWGLILMVRHRVWYGAFLLLIILYFLIISGPVGYARYRLPFEPLLIILLAIAIRQSYIRSSEIRGWLSGVKRP